MLALCFTLSLIGCSQSSSEVIELSKNKYKADSNGYVSIKGKLIENDLILNVKDDDDLLETQSCDVQDNGKFTISLKFKIPLVWASNFTCGSTTLPSHNTSSAIIIPPLRTLSNTSR